MIRRREWYASDMLSLPENARNHWQPGPYEPGIDAMHNPAVPQGAITRFEHRTDLLPGTLREYHVYVPQQHDGRTPADVLICQDGHIYMKDDGPCRATVVLDNLIAAGELPPIVAVFVEPGHEGDAIPDGYWRNRNRRSQEYDRLSDLYARFLIDELLPAVQNHVPITDDPEGRCVCGISSGGICAFTAAWERPDAFRKVISHVGSFANINGGHVYPSLVRKSAARPIRVSLQDGSNDVDNEHGCWWLANQQMAAALAFKDYDYQFVGGDGEHSLAHGGAIFPDTLRWMWRDRKPS